MIPSAALADGQLDPAFNGTGFHVGSAAEGTLFNNVENRIPMVVQADGGVIVGGSRGGFMTLVRYTPSGALDTSWGTGGFVTSQFTGTPLGGPGNSGAVAMALDGTDIVVAGFGGAQSMVAARFTSAGLMTAYAVCMAPHLIDYTARGLAVMGGGNVVLVGYARDRHAAPAVMYGQRAVVNLTANVPNPSACGTYSNPGGLSQGSSGVIIDGLGHDGVVTDATRAGRWYEGVAALANGSYVVASTNGPDANVAGGSAPWVQRFTAAGAVDGTFNPTGAGSILPMPGRVPVPGYNFHAIKLATDGSVYVGGESLDAAVATNRMLAVARIDGTGVLGGYGTGGIARSRVAGGNNTGQALAFQGTGATARVIIGGAANLAGRSAFGLTRFTAAGVRDTTFGSAGQTVTQFGTPAVNGYITGMAVAGNFVSVSGRLADAAGLITVAARYYATGNPPVIVVPPPAASTTNVDQITTTSARVNGIVNANGTASGWWIEYGTTTAYGLATPVQSVPATTDDAGVQAVLPGLAPGTAYHARVMIANAAGTDAGNDVTFTTTGTASGTAGGTTGGTTTPAAPTGGTKPAVIKKPKKRSCIVPKVVGKQLNKARTSVYAKGCKVQVRYLKSKKVKNTVLAQSRKAGKKLAFRAVVRLTVAAKAPAAKGAAAAKSS